MLKSFLLLLSGAALVVAGCALFSVPLALIVAGVGVVVYSLVREDG